MAAGVLDAVVAAGHEVRLVVSTPDTRRGRGGARGPSPVRRRAVELGLPTSDDVVAVPASGAELGVVVAYGRLVPPGVLAAVPMVNLHFSLLPRWRGAAPVERAILAGDAETGVCLMRLEEGLDTGPVLARAVVPIGEDETAEALRDRLGELGTGLLLVALAAGPDDLGPGNPQEGEATYAAKVRPEERRLDWARPAVELDRVVRVGRAHTGFRGRRLLVHRARPGPAHPDLGRARRQGVLGPDGRVGTGDGVLELVEVQPEGRGRQSIAAFLVGARIGPAGEPLG